MDLVHLFRRGHIGLGPISHDHSHSKDSENILVGNIFTSCRDILAPSLIRLYLVLPAYMLKFSSRLFFVKFDIPMIEVNRSYNLVINKSITTQI